MKPSSSEAPRPSALYVWLVPSEHVQEQPGNWRIRKWDTEPFPEANFTASAIPANTSGGAPEPFSRQELDATLADLKQMWGTLADLAMSVPGAKEVIGPRKDLPETIDMIFAQAATNGVPHEELMLTVWKDGSYLCQSVEDDRAIQMTTDWFVSIPLVAGYHALQSATPANEYRILLKETLATLPQPATARSEPVAWMVKIGDAMPGFATEQWEVDLRVKDYRPDTVQVTPLYAVPQSETPAGGTAKVREWHDRLGAMLDQAGHPDYSLREMFAGLRQLRDEMLAAAP